MSTIHYISVKHFCTFHEVERDIVFEVAEYGLIDLDKRPDDYYLPEPSVTMLERILRLRHDLGLNMPGVETVMHMRERIVELQREIEALRREVRQLSMLHGEEDVEDAW